MLFLGIKDGGEDHGHGTYAIASWIFEAAFFIDAIKDVYEAHLLSSSPPSLILYERCVNLGIRHLLLFRPPTIISRRRTLSAHYSSFYTEDH